VFPWPCVALLTTTGAGATQNGDGAWARMNGLMSEVSESVDAGMAGLRVLVICGHPRGAASLSGALARRYAHGAQAAGCVVDLVRLAELRFEPNLRAPSPRAQPLEPDLERLRVAVESADHLAFVYPTWRGATPALLKAALERVLAPGWAFEETTSGTGYAGLLGPRTAALITTMNTPGLVWRLVNGAPGDRMMKSATLGFCGLDVVRVTHLRIARLADETTRRDWLDRAEALGRSLARGALSLPQRLDRWAGLWLKALRLQFYPMCFLAYWLGALIATQAGAIVAPAFWLGYLALFLIEAATVFVNDARDIAADRANRFWGPFTGGSRVAADGPLTPRALLAAALIAGAGALLAAGFALAAAPAGAAPAAALTLTALGVAALGYTAPPLTLSHRGLGEIDVVLTHAVGVLLAGATLQGASLADPAPWIVSLPLALSIFPAILLSGVPDVEGDRLAGKRSLVVALGPARALRLAGVVALLAPAAAFACARTPGGAPLAGLWPLALAHAGVVAFKALKEARRGAAARRIDALMAWSLTLILWFVIVPLVALLR
jgi:putative NADPH-quinone reductase/1,4-dihydroxy-2-naphthoate octaprenyltransferase